jgi:two-component system sensor histidine kinase/response regulator
MQWAFGATGLIALIRLTVSDVAGNFAPFIPFVIAVVVSAWYGGLKPGLLATALSLIAADYLFVPTQHSLRIESLTGSVTLAVLAVAGLFINMTCESLHRARHLLEEERENLRRSLEAQVVASRPCCSISAPRSSRKLLT